MFYKDKIIGSLRSVLHTLNIICFCQLALIFDLVSDSESKDFFFESYRYFDPEIGRFTQPDMVVPQASGRGLDRYNYAYNNPIKYNDPDGRTPNDVLDDALATLSNAATELDKKLYTFTKTVGHILSPPKFAEDPIGFLFWGTIAAGGGARKTIDRATAIRRLRGVKGVTNEIVDGRLTEPQTELLQRAWQQYMEMRPDLVPKAMREEWRQHAFAVVLEKLQLGQIKLGPEDDHIAVVVQFGATVIRNTATNYHNARAHHVYPNVHLSQYDKHVSGGNPISEFFSVLAEEARTDFVDIAWDAYSHTLQSIAAQSDRMTVMARRRAQVAQLHMIDGLGTREVASQIGVCPETVRRHRRAIRVRLRAAVRNSMIEHFGHGWDDIDVDDYGDVASPKGGD